MSNVQFTSKDLREIREALRARLIKFRGMAMINPGDSDIRYHEWAGDTEEVLEKVESLLEEGE